MLFIVELSGNYQIVIRKELGHQIPITVFEEETEAFFGFTNYKPQRWGVNFERK